MTLRNISGKEDACIVLTVYQSWKNTERSVPALTHWPGFISWRSKWNPRRGDHTWGGISYEATHVLNADEALQERSTKVIWLTSWLLCQARNVQAHKCRTQVHTTEVQRHLTHRSKSFFCSIFCHYCCDSINTDSTRLSPEILVLWQFLVKSHLVKRNTINTV